MDIVCIGSTFERWTVIGDAPRGRNGKKRWLCLCYCGIKREVNQDSLKGRKSLSCGCLQKEAAARSGALNTTHGERRVGNTTPEYIAWRSIKNRCNNPKSKDYKDWGDRGIHVYPQWRDSYETFLKDVGRKPYSNASLDRIDNSRGYEPGNVRWTTMQTQNNNRRDNLLLTFQGRTQTAMDWAREIGLHRNAMYSRIKSGWPTERILTTPARKRKSLYRT
ncbi:MAG TPA: hypothetical protein VEP90_16635 [Methylomirabilota bacterium]|nr:hypothetical protein [Methylomirabilota bacterium]